ncbi:hypothetical protein San01_53650 [Streptomyces angustmyceticus]|uniref:Uncharacterized protein n=1 Tax=Streptomyces angustmyceticus TaxID=285578 RepID=A0A5J4LFH0_9ACTN|nr:hypothetical protein San01_53650 [Streptomyces angustmyceticus]
MFFSTPIALRLPKALRQWRTPMLPSSSAIHASNPGSLQRRVPRIARRVRFVKAPHLWEIVTWGHVRATMITILARRRETTQP